jgi:hypothetical protein
VLLDHAEELLLELAAADDALARGDDSAVSAVLNHLIELLRDDDGELEAVDPYQLLAVHRGALRALEATRHDDAEHRRIELRLGLQSARHAIRDLVGAAPIRDDVSTKEIVQWLDDVLEVPQATLAELLDISRRQLSRWLSPDDAVGPTGQDAYRVRAIARLIQHVRHALTAPGVVAWLTAKHEDLDGRTPLEAIDDPAALPLVSRLASRVRSHRAA